MQAHDHVLLAVNRSQRVSKVGIKSTLNWLSFSGFATLDTSAHEDDWTIHRLVPGPYAHNLFIEGEAPATNSPAFRCIELGAGEMTKAITAGDTTHEVCFYLRILGAQYPCLLEELPQRLHQIMVVRTETLSAQVR